MVSKLAKDIEKCLEEHLDEIKQIPLPQIKELPSYSDKEIKVNDKLCTLAIWKNQRNDGTIELIIQIYYAGWGYRLFGAGMMTADGFLIDTEGNFLKLPDEIRWKYC